VPAAAPKRPTLELADIVQKHGETFRQRHVLRPEQLAVLNAIERCRTALLGGHIDACRECGAEQQAYNSCRNRHCPKCQALSQARWVAQRMTRLLPTHYFHCVFTLPAQLRPLARRNANRVYSLLFEAASETLLELGRDPQ
jgi:predicted Zn-ribbon and HTH transcriptional regulator